MLKGDMVLKTLNIFPCELEYKKKKKKTFVYFCYDEPKQMLIYCKCLRNNSWIQYNIKQPQTKRSEWWNEKRHYHKIMEPKAQA